MVKNYEMDVFHQSLKEDEKKFKYDDDQALEITNDQAKQQLLNFTVEMPSSESNLDTNHRAQKDEESLVISSKTSLVNEADHEDGDKEGNVDHDVEDEVILEELLMADHNEPRPLQFFLQELQKKAKVQKEKEEKRKTKRELVDDLFVDDFYNPRPLHIFLEQLCTIYDQH